MKIVLIILFILIGMQFLRIDKTNPKVDENLELKTPNDIKILLKKACYDCHSNEVVYPWYSNIAPFSWIIKKHINEGRDALNFSIWNEYPKEKKEKKLKRIFQTVYSIMPLQSYIWLHKEADLSKEQRKQIRDWIKYRKKN